jgi:glycosyltransferase involved in cell wall biosynthesis
MKIAFVTYGYGQYAYGIGKYGWYLTSELRKLGVKVDVFTTNLHVRKIGPLFHSFNNLFRKLQYYDVVHSNEGAGLFVFHPNMVETYHHDYGQVHEFGYRFFNALENMECRKAKHIIVPSYASRNSLLRHGFSPEKISVIYHGVDHEIFKEDKLARKKMRSKLGLSKHFVVINVGRFVKHKGQTDLIKAMEKIPNTILILVGKGEKEKEIYSVASKSGVKVLHFKGVSDELLANLYNVADVYVHTSVLEGFGLTIIEAMACGLPIVAYKTADLGRIVGKAGFLMNIGDLDGIRSALWRLLENSNDKVQMAEIASAQSRSFSWSETANKHVKVYLETLVQNGL